MIDEDEPGRETHFTYKGVTAAILYPADNAITIKDFFVYAKGGVPVVRLDAKFDFSDIHPDSQAWVVNLLLGRRMELLGPTDEVVREDERQSERYRERKAEYSKLPWHKRLFRKPPRYGQTGD